MIKNLLSSSLNFFNNLFKPITYVFKGIKTCNICGKEFTPYGSNQKICGSAECKRARKNLYAKEYKRKRYGSLPLAEQKHCAICGNNFKPKNKVQKTCGRACSDIYSDKVKENKKLNKLKLQVKEDKKVTVVNNLSDDKVSTNPREEKVCCICNKTFISNRSNQKICSRKKCKVTRANNYAKEYAKKQKEIVSSINKAVEETVTSTPVDSDIVIIAKVLKNISKESSELSKKDIINDIKELSKLLSV